MYGVKLLFLFINESITTALSPQDMQKPFLTRPVKLVSQIQPGRAAQCAHSCPLITLARGAVCIRHCSALFRKQVLPVLLSPAPTSWNGQVVSNASGEDPDDEATAFSCMEDLRNLGVVVCRQSENRSHS